MRWQPSPRALQQEPFSRFTPLAARAIGAEDGFSACVIGTQSPGLGGQILDLLTRAGARREQHDTLAEDRKVPTHSRGARDHSPRYATVADHRR